MDGELWDVTDADGHPIGITHRRGDPDFPAGRFHIVASICLVRGDGRVLMTRRALIKDYPLMWEFPAGSVLSGETSAEGAVRELHEEAGVAVEVTQLAVVGRVVEETALFDLYAAQVPGDPPVVLDPEEVCESAWVPFAEALRRGAAGKMADPWVPRLEQLGSRLAELVEPGDWRRDPG